MCWFILSLAPLLPLFLVTLINQRVLAAKWNDVRGLMKRPGVYNAYAEAFGLSFKRDTSTGPEEDIRRLFNRHYHFWNYTAAFVLYAILTWVYTMAGLAQIDNLNGLSLEPKHFLWLIPRMSLIGFLGAYTSGLYQLVWRYGRRDITPTFAHSQWINLLFGSLLAGIVGTIPKVGSQALLAFALGFLPAFEINRWLQGYARHYLRSKEEVFSTETPTLHFLQGATRSVVLRLWEEGIDSIHHLAYADPFLLLLRTNLSWVLILDLIDQALLFNYLGERLKCLRPAGIRGAVEFASIFDDLDEQNGLEQTAPVVVKEIAARIDVPVPLVKNLLRTLHEDYQVNLVTVLFARAFGDR